MPDDQREVGLVGCPWADAVIDIMAHERLRRANRDDVPVIVTRPGPAEVLVWTASRSRPGRIEPPPIDRWLDATERARAAAMRPADQDGFVLARALLRGVLAAMLGLPPDRVPLAATCACGRPHGRVRVVTGNARVDRSLHLSITRSGPRVAVAVAGRPVGVDLTSVAAVADASVAGVAFGPGEAAWWAGDVDDRASALARAWARKEAALKAVGTGLTIEPSMVDVRTGVTTVRLGRLARVVRLVDLPEHRGEAGAVALVVPAGRARGDVPVRLDVRDGGPVLDGA